MIFKAPLIAFQSELYAMLSNADEMTFSVYDSSMTISEILNSLKNQEIVNYGVIADVSCSPTSAKADSVMWRVNVRIELFSTYRGRKQVADMINAIGSVATQYADVFDANLAAKGYRLIKMEAGESVIGGAVEANGIVWQNGYINLNYQLYQLDT